MGLYSQLALRRHKGRPGCAGHGLPLQHHRVAAGGACAHPGHSCTHSPKGALRVLSARGGQSQSSPRILPGVPVLEGLQDVWPAARTPALRPSPLAPRSRPAPLPGSPSGRVRLTHCGRVSRGDMQNGGYRALTEFSVNTR